MHIDVIVNNAEASLTRKSKIIFKKKKKEKDFNPGQKIGLQAFPFRNTNQEIQVVVVPHSSISVHELN